MSGPLRRLAEELAGAPPQRIKAISRLPYVPAPQLLPLDEANPSTPASPSPDAGLSHPATAPPIGERPASPSTAPAAARDGLPGDERPPATLLTGDVQTAAPPGALPATPVHNGHTPVPAARPSSAGGEPETTAWPEPLMPSAASAEKVNAGHNPASPPRPPDEGDDETFPPPQPIVTEMAGPQYPAGITRARIEEGRPHEHPLRRITPPASATGEVHVHIGRIEVTALQESAPSSQQAPRSRGRKPMSLDEYLARRQRDR
ncbi:MAG: hypothetical protein ABFS23_10515 [Pseudomonadota bacterium]